MMCLVMDFFDCILFALTKFLESVCLSLKKVGKTTRSFRYDLNQIPYDYTVEVTNRFKGLKIHGSVVFETLIIFPSLPNSVDFSEASGSCSMHSVQVL